jgi:hypothetical protein
MTFPTATGMILLNTVSRVSFHLRLEHRRCKQVFPDVS